MGSIAKIRRRSGGDLERNRPPDRGIPAGGLEKKLRTNPIWRRSLLNRNLAAVAELGRAAVGGVDGYRQDDVVSSRSVGIDLERDFVNADLSGRQTRGNHAGAAVADADDHLPEDERIGTGDRDRVGVVTV